MKIRVNLWRNLNLNLRSKERVVLFLLAHCGHRAVAGAYEGFVRQGQDFLEVVCKASRYDTLPPPIEPAKSESPTMAIGRDEPGYNVRHAARRMTPRQSRIDLQISKPEMLSLFDGLGARH